MNYNYQTLRRKYRSKSCGLRLDNGFLDITQKAKVAKEKVENKGTLKKKKTLLCYKECH